MKFLKSTLVMTSIASILLMSNAQAVTYKFIAADDSRETKLCILAGSNEIRNLKQKVRNFPRFARLIPNARFIANEVKCNDMFMESFASKYNADDVANYLDKYTYPKNKRMETNVSIKDIASLPKNNDMPDKVITVYVGR